MEQELRSRRGVLTTLIVLLFAAALITFPYAFNLTWSSPAADRTLTYTVGSLTWDSAAKIDKNGVIQLSMFDSGYDNVKSADGGNVVAPGTRKTTNILLKNTVSGSIRYTAVLYRLDNTDVPIVAGLTGPAVTNYYLPKGVKEEQVVSAVGGTVNGGSVKTLDISWNWDFFKDAEGDERDTMLGNKSPADKVEYGLYIVVEDDNYYGGGGINNCLVVPPKSGDNSTVKLLVLSVLAMCAALAFTHRDKRAKKSAEKE